MIERALSMPRAEVSMHRIALRQPLGDFTMRHGDFPESWREPRQSRGDFDEPPGEFSQPLIDLSQPLGELPEPLRDFPKPFRELPQRFGEGVKTLKFLNLGDFEAFERLAGPFRARLVRWSLPDRGGYVGFGRLERASQAKRVRLSYGG